MFDVHVQCLDVSMTFRVVLYRLLLNLLFLVSSDEGRCFVLPGEWRGYIPIVLIRAFALHLRNIDWDCYCMYGFAQEEGVTQLAVSVGFGEYISRSRPNVLLRKLGITPACALACFVE